MRARKTSKPTVKRRQQMGATIAATKQPVDELKELSQPQQRAEVRQAFLKKKKLKGGNLLSDGKSLWSYGWWEVARWVRGQVIIRSGKGYSRTTERKHRRALPGTLAKKETPRLQAKMNL